MFLAKMITPNIKGLFESTWFLFLFDTLRELLQYALQYNVLIFLRIGVGRKKKLLKTLTYVSTYLQMGGQFEILLTI